MHEHIRKSLDQSIPEQVRLRDERKRAIVAEAHRRLEKGSPTRKPALKPLISAVAVVGIAGFLAVPYIQHEMGEKAIVESMPSEVVHKVSILGENLATLITAIYVDKTKEMIFTDGYRIYAYNTESKIKEILVEREEDANISGYNVAANERWIVWKQDDIEGYSILNRLNGEVRNIPDELHGMQIDGDQLNYTSVSQGNIWFTQLDLKTLEQTQLIDLHSQRLKLEYTRGATGKFIITDYGESDSSQFKFTVHDLKSQRQIGEYSFPYENAINLSISGNKVFAELFNEGDTGPVLGYVDLTDGQFYIVETPKFFAYAVFEDILALDVPVKDSRTIKLYRIENNQAHALPVLDHIQERLVKPRFTPEGSLVVNVEGTDFYSLYVVDATKLK
ncbi:hypothetical protein [Sporosarcina koreensis]|uniref:hypothetical protein n=1 Tax=Sporosarcina koreensis TaxID=334735 RepID=UPI0007585939|nr:hypothetical protein [Sporosarcina koreensis]